MNNKLKHLMSLVGLIIFLMFAIGSVDESGSSSTSSKSSSSRSKTFYCNYCGDSYKGRGYTTLMRVVNRVDSEDSPLNSYCSASCARDCIRVECW